jgi:hypothetical protein
VHQEPVIGYYVRDQTTGTIMEPGLVQNSALQRPGTRWVSCLAAALVLAATTVAAGCDATPAGPAAEEAVFAVELDWGLAGMPLMRPEHGLTLEQLLRSALQTATREERAAGVQALQQRLQPRREAVGDAAQANDGAASLGARVALGRVALRAEMATIVIEILGTEVSQRTIDEAAPILTAAAERIAGGRATPVLERMLMLATATLNEGQAALAADQPVDALQKATEAVLMAGRARMRAAGPVTPPTMPRLLARAWAQAVDEGGQAAANALFGPMREKNAALKASLRTRDLGTVRTAQDALRSEQIGLIVSVLGATAPEQVLDDVARMVEQMATRAESMKLINRDVSQIEATLREAAGLHAEGTAALHTGDLTGALDRALQAADRIIHTRS